MDSAQVWDNNDYWGDDIAKKPAHILRLGFQNIGGFSFSSGSNKDDKIRHGINLWEFDIVGLAELNIDWRLIPEQDRLYFRTKPWWKTVHISSTHNTTSPPIQRKQFGGTALLSLGSVVHHITGTGSDPSGLGRWTWSLYRGKNQRLLKVYTAYRPNPPSGPFSVYAQHQLFFTSQNNDRCPRKVFLEDISADIQQSSEEGAHILVMLDGNEDMRLSSIASYFSRLHLREVILSKHGTSAPSTFKRNSNNVPIDGIWASPGLNIQRGGISTIR